MVEQSGYTLGVAAQDKTVLAAEAKPATTTQNQRQRDATVWVRGVGKRCQSAMQLGAPLAPELEKVSSPATVPGMLDQVQRTLSLLGKHAADMDKVGLPVQSHIRAIPH